METRSCLGLKSELESWNPHSQEKRSEDTDKGEERRKEGEEEEEAVDRV